MNRDFICFENGKIILNVNTIVMVFPDDNSNDITCINVISGNRTYYIKENYESVKKKLNDWIAKEE